MVLCGAALRRLAAVFEAEVEAGLREQPSSLQMENTYVPELPDGTGKLCSRSRERLPFRERNKDDSIQYVISRTTYKSRIDWPTQEI